MDDPLRSPVIGKGPETFASDSGSGGTRAQGSAGGAQGLGLGTARGRPAAQAKSREGGVSQAHIGSKETFGFSQAKIFS